MGLQDRDYMRRPHVPPRQHVPPRRGTNWRTWLVAAGSVIAVASAAIWLLRDFQSLVPASGRREGSLAPPFIAPREGSLVVNINDSTPEQLETVPGIGPSLAALIIAGRPYQRVDDLLRISGIGERTLQSMRPFVKTDGETRPR